MPDTTYPVPGNPVYNPDIRAIQDDDPVSASGVVNPVLTQMIENTHAVKRAADAALPRAEKGTPGGVASLDESGRLILEQFPEVTGDTEELRAHKADTEAHGDIRAGVTGLDSRITKLELIVGGGISTNQFSFDFTALTDVEVAGVWNKSQGRIEF